MKSSQTLAAELSAGPPRSLGRQARHGVVWTTAQSLVNRGSGVVVFLVLARLLTPHEFGVLAAAQVFISLAQTFAEAGLTRTLVQRPRLRASHLDSALLVSGGAGLVLGLALAVAAPFVAHVYRMPQLEPVLFALAAVPVMTGISSVPESILRRELRFRSLALRGTSSVVVAGVLSVVMAVLGFGVWALVGQVVCQSVVAAVVLWASTGWRPSTQWDRTSVSELLGFGSHVLGISLLNFVTRRSGEFLVGVTIGPVALGLFTVANRILNLLMDLMVSNVQKVAMPVFSRVSEEPARLRDAYLRATHTTTLVAFPGFVLLALFGTRLTPVLFGQQWTTAGPLMGVLALVGPAQSISYFNNSMMLARGASGLALRWTAATAVASVAVFLATVPFGITVVAVGITVRTWLLLPVGLLLVRRVSAVTLRDQLVTLRLPALGSLTMAVVVAAYDVLLPTQGPVVHVLLAGGLAVAGYVGTVAVADPALARQLPRVVRRRLRGRGAGSVPATPVEQLPRTGASDVAEPRR